MYASGLADMFVGLLVFAVLAGAAIMGLLVWVVPLVWAWVKPWLHAITG